ncbi:hypothetical protein QL285_041829 [Trifolium repens]|jgi:hypothetical protein|nr:hypothetical protein QL285_041829 [Trifolium repens]
MTDKEFQAARFGKEIDKINATIISKQQTIAMLEVDQTNLPTKSELERRLKVAIQEHNDLIAEHNALLATKQHAIVSGQ